jgi:hypothetical protein
MTTQALLQFPMPLVQRPTCLVWYAGDPCDQAIQQYNQMLLDRQQVQWDFSVAEPLRKQITEQRREIADQQNQIKTLQVTIDAQTLAAIQREASNRASLDMLGAILGVGLAFFAAYATFRRLARNAPRVERVEHERGRAASASS